MGGAGAGIAGFALGKDATIVAIILPLITFALLFFFNSAIKQVEGKKNQERRIKRCEKTF
ncbi:MAG TPA: hypothetical protein VK074_08275 [Fodinibius sp.]|nr:hypothetical protein [Bacillota bacterium]HLR32471.1 hypothetical protein [Fodinibius sp.]